MKDQDLMDEFAKAAMNGIVNGITMSSPEAIENQKELWAERWGGVSIIDCISKDSYMIAEAMMKERSNILEQNVQCHGK